MVICLMKKVDLFIKYFIILLVLIFLFYVGNIINYFKYKDYEYVDMNSLSVINNDLSNRINEIEEINNLSKSDYSYGIERVLYRDIYNISNQFIVKNNNYSVGDIVLNSNGLIGIVNLVDDGRCYIENLNNDMNISVKINDYYGVLNNSVISMLDKYSDIKEGDKVYTSGLTNIYGDIYVGDVIKVYMSSNELEKMAIIRLNDYSNINYVSVVRLNHDIY